MEHKDKKINVAPADTSQWSEESKKSLSFHWIKEYKDIQYNCWHCKKKSVFTALDQKYTYEVKKSYIDQRRILCPECHIEFNLISEKIKSHEERWATGKLELKNDVNFLSNWLNLLNLREKFKPYKTNTAAKNMLKNLLGKNA